MASNNILRWVVFLGFVSLNLFAALDDENWDNPFSGNWSGGEVRSMVVLSNQLYAAGRFTTAGDKPAISIARWNGTNWTDLLGLNGWYAEAPVNALATNNSGLFATGEDSGVGRWNGTNWQNLSSPGFLPMDVNLLTGSGTDLYAGGYMMFNTTLTRLARWNGTSWTSITIPLHPAGSAYPTALVAKGAYLYVGGDFLPGTGAGPGVARWTSGSWGNVGAANGAVLALAFSGNDLFAAGEFTTMGGISASGIAKWNGTNWSALGSGVNGKVMAITVVGSNVYVAGRFTSAGGVACKNLACWNGASWVAVNAQVTGLPNALAGNGSTLYVGGAIEQLNNQPVGNVFSYSSGTANALGAGLRFAQINVLRTNGTSIIAGGEWRTINGTNSPALARFDGTNWYRFGSALTNWFGDPTVSDVLVVGTNTFVAGVFDGARGINATNVIRWNGANWQGLGTGLTNPGYWTVNALASFGNDVYAAGYLPAYQGVAKWNGTNWSKVGTLDNVVNALSTFNNQLYAGGSFFSPYRSIARWNGTSWSSVGSAQFNNSVLSMSANSTYLFVGGWFTSIGGGNIGYIARWDGNSWSALGSGLDGPADKMQTVGNDLYVGGRFKTAGGITVNGVARWDGTNWHSLGSGFLSREFFSARAFAPLANEVLIGGNFLNVGTNSYPYLASWRFAPMTLGWNRSGSSVSVSWPSTLSKFTLQTASDLSSGWSNALQASALSNNVYTVMTNTSAEAGFFRLRKN